MPSPEQRKNQAGTRRIGQLKNAAKQWNSSYWTQLSWSDIAWGATRKTGMLAYSIGKSIAMDQLKVGVLQKMSVDTCSALGTFGAMARDAVGNMAAYANSEEADKITTTTVDQIWGSVSDWLTGTVESVSGSVGSGQDGRKRSSEATSEFKRASGDGWDPVDAMAEVKSLFLDTLVTVAELQAVSTAATSGKMPFNYCDDAHAMWTRYYRTVDNIEALKEHCDKLALFANKAKQTVTTAKTNLSNLENQLTAMTESAVDSGQMPHYEGGGIFSMRSRMSQCSNVKCFGPA